MAGGTERDWLRPEVLAEAGRPIETHRPAMFELRPLSLGEVLDRTFSLYRSRFWLFASIASVSASVQVIVQAVSLATARFVFRSIAPNGPGHGGRPMALHGLVSAELGTWIAALLFFMVSAITQAATSLAMSEVYLNQPASARAALRVAARRWYRWVGIALWQLGSMLWILLAALVPGLLLLGFGTRASNPALTVIGGVLIFLAFCGGFPAGFILYLRNTLAIPAAMVERLTIRPAMRRSKTLAAGTKGRIFVVLLIAGALYYLVALLESPATILIMLAPKQQHYLAQAIALLVTFVGHTVVAPVALIGLTLVYFDQRVRKEALDLQLLLEGNRKAGYPGAPAAPMLQPDLDAAAVAPKGIAPLG